LPLNDGLGTISPENPVLLIHASGHSAIANPKALAIAGIDAKTADPAGGQIVRDGRGEPPGAAGAAGGGAVSRRPGGAGVP
jgi:predicted amidohydrolase YtcJ